MADLAGPPRRGPRGFPCGSSAGLSGPPRRGPRGVIPRGCLFLCHCWSYQRGTRIAATGEPLLGSTLDLLSGGLALGGVASYFPVSNLPKNVAAISAAGAFFGMFLAGAFEPPWLASPSPSRWALPACVAPPTVVVLDAEELDERPRCSADVLAAFPRPSVLGVVSWARRHGSQTSFRKNQMKSRDGH